MNIFPIIFIVLSLSLLAYLFWLSFKMLRRTQIQQNIERQKQKEQRLEQSGSKQTKSE